MYFNTQCPECRGYLETVIDYSYGQPIVYAKCKCGYDSRSYYTGVKASNKTIMTKFSSTSSTSNALNQTQRSTCNMRRNRTRSGGNEYL